MYWRELALHELSQEQWEALCDGCGRCCLHKLQDDETEEVYYTNIACKLLDTQSCRCQDYANRLERVAECLHLTADKLNEVDWLPNTCAYRLLAEGQDLPAWHPLISGNPASVHQAGISVRAKVISEDGVPEEEYEEHIIHWVEQE